MNILRLLRLFLVCVLLNSLCWSLSEGPNSAGTGANDSSYGFIAWSNPGNVVSSNNIDATVNLAADDLSQYIKATNFGFSIPTGSTIDGIEIFIERRQQSGASCEGDVSDDRVRIVKGGTVGSTEKRVLSNWPTIDATATYGSDTDKWGETWTVSDINASDFGMVIAILEQSSFDCTAEIDHISATVYYTAAAAESQNQIEMDEHGTVGAGIRIDIP